MTIKLAVNGAAGRMGEKVIEVALANKLTIAAALESDTYSKLSMPLNLFIQNAPANLHYQSKLSANVDVIIDFSTPESTMMRVQEAVQQKCAIVIGTTGFTPEQIHELAIAAIKIPMIRTANFSLGVNLLTRIVADVAKALGEEFDIEITEAHHNKKADAPSGTALMLAQSICNVTNRDVQSDLMHGRNFRTSIRDKREIGMHALRMGSIVGDHTVYFSSNEERIELTHRAQSRNVFAVGAVRAAQWLAGKPEGFYTMQDVLFS